MSLLNKVTMLLILVLFIVFGLLYIVKTDNAVKKTGIIQSLAIKKVHRTENIFKITLRSAEQIEFNFDEISPLFDVKRNLDLHSGDRIAYFMSEKNEVLSLWNIENGRQISSVFYIFNLVVSNVFAYIIILLLAGIQAAYVFYNYNFMILGTKKPTKVADTVERINQFVKINVVFIPLFFVLFFFLLYQFSSKFNTLIAEPTSGLLIQKYVLNFIIFLLLVLLLSINMYLVQKIKRMNNFPSPS